MKAQEVDFSCGGKRVQPAVTASSYAFMMPVHADAMLLLYLLVLGIETSNYMTHLI